MLKTVENLVGPHLTTPSVVWLRSTIGYHSNSRASWLPLFFKRAFLLISYNILLFVLTISGE